MASVEYIDPDRIDEQQDCPHNSRRTIRRNSMTQNEGEVWWVCPDCGVKGVTYAE